MNLILNIVRRKKKRTIALAASRVDTGHMGGSLPQSCAGEGRNARSFFMLIVLCLTPSVVFFPRRVVLLLLTILSIEDP